MSPCTLRHFVFALILLFSGSISRGGMTDYTDRGKIDFDMALQVLNPYGTWSKIDGSWAYTPLDHATPYTDGRWIYTEYGWYWKGNRPYSWVTEHYGYWKRGADQIWSWYPGPYWLPKIVEMRATSTHIGWRSAAVDSDGNFVEEPLDRYDKTDEWVFVTLAQFAGPITPQIIAKPDVAKEQIEDSTDSRHTYFTYRGLDRPGPHPADFLKLGDGGMFAPKTLEDELAAQHPPPSASLPKTNLVTTPVNGTAPPALVGTQPNPEIDMRQVKYWITMSLPTYWTKPPGDAKPEQIYLYRPDFYQDDDGIARRITLWFNPQSRATLRDVFANNLPSAKSAPDATSGTATPAVPAASTKAGDPFRSPFDDSYRPGDASRPASPSTKKPAAPSGFKSTDMPVPLPATNAAPMNPH